MANYNLFDAASLAMIPVGSKEGKVYSIKPEPVYGAELVTNGDFATDSGWTKGTGWTIGSGVASCDGTQTGNTNLSQAPYIIGKIYLTTIDVVVTSGTLKVFTGTGSPSIITSISDSFTVNLPADGSSSIYIQGDLNFIGSVDNVSVKEVLTSSGDFDFSRGSNLAATRVGADGLIEKGRENLLTYSNQFNTTWTGSISLTSGQSGYDGLNDAWLLSAPSANNFLYRNDVTSFSGVMTISVYAKKGTADGIRLRFNQATDANIYINLINGSDAASASGVISHNVTSLTNGWYRIEMTFRVSSPVDIRIYPTNTSGGAVAENIFIQDSQAEIGLAVTEYIESGATKGTAGILEQTPRFDYSNGASCPSLLLEPSRTNAWTYSEPVSGANEAPSNITTFAPIDMFSAIGIYGGVEFTGGLTRYQYGGYVAVNTSYSLSCYMRKSDSTAPILANNTADSNGDFVFVLGGYQYGLNDISSSDYSIELFKDDIYKVVFTYTTGASVNGANNGILKDDANSNVNLFVTGFQFEQGSYPTSYIPNYSGGTETRAAEVCGGAGDANTFNSTEGVLYFEVATNTDNDDKAISLNNSVAGSSNNRLWMGYSTTAKRVYTLGYVNNSLQFVFSKLMTDETAFVKIACKYALNDVSFFVNGEKIGTDTSALAFIGFNSLDFNIGNGTGGAPFYGNVKQVLTFNTALSDTELAALTTL